jgi:hypothetical protein
MSDNINDFINNLLEGDAPSPVEAVEKEQNPDKELQEKVDFMLNGGLGGSNSVVETDTSMSHASQYDKGYTPQHGAIDQYRAINQTGWDQAANRIVKTIPNMVMGIGELVGYIGDAPDNLYGMATDGDSMSGGKNDFSNWLSSGLQDWGEKMNKNWMVNYKETPGKAIDPGDTAFWIDNGFVYHISKCRSFKCSSHS